jgi:hypothetical protein
MSDSAVFLFLLFWFLVGLAGVCHEATKLLRRRRS